MLSILQLTDTLTSASGKLLTLTNTARWVLVCGDSTAWLQDEQKNCELEKRSTYLDMMEFSSVNALNIFSTYFAPLLSVIISRFAHVSHTNQQQAVSSSTPITTPAIKDSLLLNFLAAHTANGKVCEMTSLHESTMTGCHLNTQRWPLAGWLGG